MIKMLPREAMDGNSHEIFLQTGLQFKIFGDAGFVVSEYIQAIVKGCEERDFETLMFNERQDFKNLMSRIRICIENSFADIANELSYFSYEIGLTLGGRRYGKF